MKQNNSWYSVILSILMVWFMLVLTSWVFLLVLWENKDTKAMEYYLKSFAWAEWAIEIALLKAKKYNYSYSDKLEKWQPISKVLFRGTDLYHFNKDVFISYNLDATSNEVINKKLQAGKFDIIPLFYYNQNGEEKKVTNIELFWQVQDVVWNIIWEDSWISWIGNVRNNTPGNYKIISWTNVSYEKKLVWDFLKSSEKNYLILHNTTATDIDYNLRAPNPWELITKEASSIIWTGEIWGYKQNLRVIINSSEYLNLLKYSIFSN